MSRRMPPLFLALVAVALLFMPNPAWAEKGETLEGVLVKAAGGRIKVTVADKKVIKVEGFLH